MNGKNLLIIGAGQYGAVASETAEAMGCFSKISFLDDHNPMAIGRISELETFVQEYANIFVAIGNPEIRLEWIEKAEKIGYGIATLISTKAYISPSARLLKGSIVEPCAVIQSNATVGLGCIISSGAVINHNAIIGRGCHIDCNATVAARMEVPLKTKVESGKVYRE